MKAGAIIPLAAKGIQNLQGISDELRIYIAPGKGRSSYVHYEDDGVSQAYPTEYATTRITKEANAVGVTVEIGPANGEFQGKPFSRKLSLVLGGVSRCPEAMLNGRTLDCSYDADTREVTVFLPPTPASQTQKVVVRY